jgi:predicted metal-dependent hydrolase
MQLGLPFARDAAGGEAVVLIDGHPVPVAFTRHRRARHYILRVAADGGLRVTMPWRGSQAEALRFVHQRHAWIARERYARSLEAGRRGLPAAVERELRMRAARELPVRLRELAAQHGFTVRAVSVRAQRTRWGSCSPTGRISLNWRLIQLPASVADYVLLHELAHLAHLNHSARFWKELERICPWHREARAWLRGNARLHAFGL